MPRKRLSLITRKRMRESQILRWNRERLAAPAAWVRTCPLCNTKFEVKSPSNKRMYCSVACFNRRPLRKPDMIRQCERCGKDFKRYAGHVNQKYCSLECCRVPLTERLCKGCGKPFMPTMSSANRQSRQLFCDKHCWLRTYAKSKRIQSGNLGNWREAKAILLKETNGHCARCGWSEVPEVLEIHHIDRNRHNNRRGNLKLLCPNCHAMDHFTHKDGQFKANLGVLNAFKVS